MGYELRKCTDKDASLLIDYKLRSIFDYIEEIDDNERNRIVNYVNNSLSKLLEFYKIILVDNKIAGCFLYYPYEDGIILDEIYIEKEYRNKKIGTSLINSLKDNNIYLWVYKKNINAFKLYKKLRFNVIDETKERYQMKFDGM